MIFATFFIATFSFLWNFWNNFTEKSAKSLPIIHEKNGKKFYVNSYRMADLSENSNIFDWRKNWNIKLFSCKNFEVYWLTGDISVISTQKYEYFFDENMASWDHYFCEKDFLQKINISPAENSIYYEENFYKNYYEKFSCEKKDENFIKITKNNEEISIKENIKICEKMEEKTKEKWKILKSAK